MVFARVLLAERAERAGAWVILLLERVFAAVAAYYQAGEAMQAREWVGGAMIVALSLFSGKLTELLPG